VGYVVEELDPPPRINRDRCFYFGVGQSKAFDALKMNLKIRNDDNTRDVTLEDVALDFGKNRARKVTFLGDSFHVPTPMATLASKSDLVVHEATLSDGAVNERVAKSRGHSVPRMAAEFGRKVEAKSIMLTHFSNRYAGDRDENDHSVSVADPKHNVGALRVLEQIEEEEGRKMKLIWGCDLMEIMLKRDRNVFVEHEDGIGAEYAEDIKAKEDLDEDRLEEHAAAVTGASGFILHKNGNMSEASREQIEQANKTYNRLEQEKINLTWDAEVDWVCQSCGARNTRKKKLCFVCNVGSKKEFDRMKSAEKKAETTAA